MGRRRVAKTTTAAAALVLVLLGAAQALPGDCFLPKIVGRCRASFPRWWYNATTQTCQQFIFGGCKGNSNNFPSKDSCRQMCAPESEIQPIQQDGGTQPPFTHAAPTRHREEEEEEEAAAAADTTFKDYCAAPPVIGPCRAAFPRWYFSTKAQTCKGFIYGGCGGNRNNYLLEQDCLSRCGGGRRETPEEPDFHSSIFPDPTVHSTRTLGLAILLAVMAAFLLGSIVVFMVKICRKSQELALSPVWNTLDDKEYLMSNAYTL